MQKTLPNNIQAVIFDMDGVLCDSEPFICEAACRMFLENHATRVQPADFQPFIGTGENRYLSGVAQKYGITLDLEGDKARTYAIYLDIIKGRLQALPGVKEFINACCRRGWKTAVATSADTIKMKGNLREIGLTEEHFNARVTGSEVERKKPEPDLFLEAARRLNTPPFQCLVIEDAPNGIEAARRGGMSSVGLTSSFSAQKLQDCGAWHTASDLEQVLTDFITWNIFNPEFAFEK